MTVKFTSKQQLSRHLNVLTRGFRFRWGEPANCGDDTVCIALDQNWDRQDQVEYLVTVYATHVPREYVSAQPWELREAGTGKIVRFGQTDRLGSFRLRGLADGGEYRLQMRGLAGLFAFRDVKRESFAMVFGEITVTGRVEDIFEEFHSADGAVMGCVRDQAGELILECEVQLARLGQEAFADQRDQWQHGVGLVARFHLSMQDSIPLCMGYVGLYEGSKETAVGEIYLGDFAPGVTPENEDLRLEITLVPSDQMTEADRDDLQRSLEASDDASHDALAEVVDRLG